jgi:hypothetical protein
MSQTPDMPDDFWPEEIIVVGKYKNHELAFAITLNGFHAGTDLAGFETSINALRRCLWNEVEHQI